MVWLRTHLRTLRCSPTTVPRKHIITVLARKRADTILESDEKYYGLSTPAKTYDRELAFYVLERENGGGIRPPKYRIIRAIAFPNLMR